MSAREIHVFIGGALAFTGFHSLMMVPLDLSSDFDVGARISFAGAQLLSSLSLPLGIAVLLNYKYANCWTKVWLWFAVIFYILSFLSACTAIQFSSTRIWGLVPSTAGYIILLCLFLWKPPEKVQTKSENQI